MKTSSLLTVILFSAIAVIGISQTPWAGTIYTDGFEGWADGAYPAPPWQNMFSGVSAYVTSSVAHTGAKSFRSESYPGWARWDYVLIDTLPDNLEYSGAVQIMTAGRGGALGFGYVEPGNPSTGWNSNSVVFGGDGMIAFYSRTVGYLVLRPYSAGVWYEVVVQIDYLNQLADVYIDGVLEGDDLPCEPKVLPASVYEVPVPTNRFGFFGWNYSGGGTGVMYLDDVMLLSPEMVDVDIKPGSCPNPLSLTAYADGTDGIIWEWEEDPIVDAPVDRKSHGGTGHSKAVIPVAILGSDELDVTEIDRSTVTLAGVPALRAGFEDVGTPMGADAEACECNTLAGDGYMDLTLKFDKAAVIAALPPVSDRDVVPLTLAGALWNGTPIEGTDCVWIISGGSFAALNNPPDKPVISSCYPNPFNPSTSFSITFPQATTYTVTIHNIAGQTVRTFAGDATPGITTITWDGTNQSGRPVASGVYFYRLQAGDFIQSRKMLLMK